MTELRLGTMFSEIDIDTVTAPPSPGVSHNLIGVLDLIRKKYTSDISRPKSTESTRVTARRLTLTTTTILNLQSLQQNQSDFMWRDFIVRLQILYC